MAAAILTQRNGGGTGERSAIAIFLPTSPALGRCFLNEKEYREKLIFINRYVQTFGAFNYVES
jgi:hypothetical protein